MNPSKPLIFAAACLITVAGVAGIRAYADTASRTAIPRPAEMDGIPTLPTIEVRPTRAQLEAVRRENAGIAAIGGAASFDMPYYSFAVQPEQVGKG